MVCGRWIFISKVALLLLLGGCSSPGGTDYSALSSSALVSSVRDGDIIMRKGKGLVSSAICGIIGDSVANASHCGIVVFRDGEPFVIHSISSKLSEANGIQLCSLRQFVEESQSGSIKVSRLRADAAGDLECGAVIARRAEYYLSKKVPFDNQIDISDTTAFFCSELPLHILKTSFGLDIFSGPGIPKFSLFLDERLFESFSRKLPGIN